MSPIWTTIAGVLIGASGGGVSGLLGVGGAAILSPLVQLTFGCSQHVAQGISLAVILPPVGIPALLAYARRDVRPDWGLVAFLILGFSVAAYAGSRLAERLPDGVLRLLFSAFLLVSAYRVVRSVQAQAAVPSGTPVNASPFPSLSLGRKFAVGIAVGAAAGVCSGLLGIGGGIILVPALQRFAGQTRLAAQATSLAMMLPPVGLPAVMVYAASESFPLRLVVIMACGFVGGAYVGGRAATQMKPKGAAYAFGALLVTLAAVMVFRSVA